MKTNKTKLKELSRNLHYWQTQGRIYRRWVRDTNVKCKEIAEEMRKLQK